MTDYLQQNPGLIIDKYPIGHGALGVVYPALYLGKEVVVKEAKTNGLETLVEEGSFLLSPTSRIRYRGHNGSLLMNPSIYRGQISVELIKPIQGANSSDSLKAGKLVLPYLKGQRLVDKDGQYNPTLPSSVHIAVWSAWVEFLKLSKVESGIVFDSQPADFDLTIQPSEGDKIFKVIKFDCNPVIANENTIVPRGNSRTSTRNSKL